MEVSLLADGNCPSSWMGKHYGLDLFSISYSATDHYDDQTYKNEKRLNGRRHHTLKHRSDCSRSISFVAGIFFFCIQDLHVPVHAGHALDTSCRISIFHAHEELYDL